VRVLLATLLLAAVAAVSGAHATAAPPTRAHLVPGFGVSVRLPATWKAVDPSVLRQPKLVKEIVEKNPSLSEELLRKVFGPGSPVEFLAFDPDLHNGFATNLNLIVAPLRGLSLRDWLVGQLPARVRPRVVRLPAGPALHVASTGLVRLGPAPLFTDQYTFARGSRAYLFTYTTRVSTAGQYRATFAASARSIRFR